VKIMELTPELIEGLSPHQALHILFSLPPAPMRVDVFYALCTKAGLADWCDDDEVIE
jgi:hypothetical protein